MLTTETGREFPNVDELYLFIRDAQRMMLDPKSSAVGSGKATVEMVYAFKALDGHLQGGGALPEAWARAARPGVKAQLTRPRDRV